MIGRRVDSSGRMTYSGRLDMSEGDQNVGDEAGRGPMDQFTAHLDRAWDLVHRGDLRGALLSAEKSIELDPQSPEAYNLLGYVKAALGQADEALEHYKHALALDDTFVEAMLNASEVLIHPLHEFEAAIAMVEEALDFAENDDEIADALLLKYDAYLHQGDTDSAARVAKRLPDGPFESPRLDFLVGRAHFETGGHAEAKRLLSSAVTRETFDADAHYTLALVHEALGDTTAMVAAFLDARAVDLMVPPVPWTLDRPAFAARAKAAIERLPVPLRNALENAQVIVAESPGAEVVADGIDPRVGVLLDTAPRGAGPALAVEPNVTRIFVYQRNLERAAEQLSQLDDELDLSLEEELCAQFPELATHATQRTRPDGHEH